LGYVRTTVALSILGMLLIASGVGLVLFNPRNNNDNNTATANRGGGGFDQELVPILKS